MSEKEKIVYQNLKEKDLAAAQKNQPTYIGDKFGQNPSASKLEKPLQPHVFKNTKAAQIPAATVVQNEQKSQLTILVPELDIDAERGRLIRNIKTTFRPEKLKAKPANIIGKLLENVNLHIPERQYLLNFISNKFERNEYNLSTLEAHLRNINKLLAEDPDKYKKLYFAKAQAKAASNVKS